VAGQDKNCVSQEKVLW
jgi:hypothetical protein